MRKLTLNACRTTLARVLETCATDTTKIASYANEAQERLLNRPDDPVGSWMRYRVCTNNNCLVWPRQIRTIKLGWVCNQPFIVRSEWFEGIGYHQGGQGALDNNSFAGNQLIDRGTTHCFANVSASSSEPRKLQVVASDPADNGRTIHVRYIDSNGNRYFDSNGLEGETLTLSTAGTLTTSALATNGWYHVTKQTTSYPVRVYSYDTNSATQAALLAYYEPSETEPIYRRTFLPGLSDRGSCVDSSCSENKSVEILAKLQHVPVVTDNDPFVIGNLAALKLMAKGILMEERHEQDLAEYYFGSAARELDGEIASYLGDGIVMAVRTPDVDTWGPGGILNAV